MKEDGVGLMAAGGVGVIVGEGIGVLAGSGALVAVGAGEAPCAFWRMKWKSPKAPGSSTYSAVGKLHLTCARLVVGCVSVRSVSTCRVTRSPGARWAVLEMAWISSLTHFQR